MELSNQIELKQNNFFIDKLAQNKTLQLLANSIYDKGYQLHQKINNFKPNNVTQSLDNDPEYLELLMLLTAFVQTIKQVYFSLNQKNIEEQKDLPEIIAELSQQLLEGKGETEKTAVINLLQNCYKEKMLHRQGPFLQILNGHFYSMMERSIPLHGKHFLNSFENKNLPSFLTTETGEWVDSKNSIKNAFLISLFYHMWQWQLSKQVKNGCLEPQKLMTLAQEYAQNKEILHLLQDNKNEKIIIILAKHGLIEIYCAKQLTEEQLHEYIRKNIVEIAPQAVSELLEDMIVLATNLLNLKSSGKEKITSKIFQIAKETLENNKNTANGKFFLGTVKNSNLQLNSIEGFSNILSSHLANKTQFNKIHVNCPSSPQNFFHKSNMPQNLVNHPSPILQIDENSKIEESGQENSGESLSSLDILGNYLKNDVNANQPKIKQNVAELQFLAKFIYRNGHQINSQRDKKETVEPNNYLHLLMALTAFVQAVKNFTLLATGKSLTIENLPATIQSFSDQLLPSEQFNDKSVVVKLIHSCYAEYDIFGKILSATNESQCCTIAKGGTEFLMQEEGEIVVATILVAIQSHDLIEMNLQLHIFYDAYHQHLTDINVEQINFEEMMQLNYDSAINYCQKNKISNEDIKILSKFNLLTAINSATINRRMLKECICNNIAVMAPDEIASFLTCLINFAKSCKSSAKIINSLISTAAKTLASDHAKEFLNGLRFVEYLITKIPLSEIKAFAGAILQQCAKNIVHCPIDKVVENLKSLIIVASKATDNPKKVTLAIIQTARVHLWKLDNEKENEKALSPRNQLFAFLNGKECDFLREERNLLRKIKFSFNSTFSDNENIEPSTQKTNTHETNTWQTIKQLLTEEPTLENTNQVSSSKFSLTSFSDFNF